MIIYDYDAIESEWMLLHLLAMQVPSGAGDWGSTPQGGTTN